MAAEPWLRHFVSRWSAALVLQNAALRQQLAKGFRAMCGLGPSQGVNGLIPCGVYEMEQCRLGKMS